MLEVIAEGRSSQAHQSPILFVHGAFHAAWCWDEHFLDFFAEMGYHAIALGLRGHGESAASTPLRKSSIGDYVEDVREVADTLPTKPILVGHSMGGFIVQKYLQSRTAPASVLIASPPPRGHLATARAYGTTARFIGGMGHDVMLEPGWSDAAREIHSWLSSRGL